MFLNMDHFSHLLTPDTYIKSLQGALDFFISVPDVILAAVVILGGSFCFAIFLLVWNGYINPPPQDPKPGLQAQAQSQPQPQPQPEQEQERGNASKCPPQCAGQHEPRKRPHKEKRTMTKAERKQNQERKLNKQCVSHLLSISFIQLFS